MIDLRYFEISEILTQVPDISRGTMLNDLSINCLKDDKSGHLQHGIREKNIKFVWGNPDKFEVNKRFKESS